MPVNDGLLEFLDKIAPLIEATDAFKHFREDPGVAPILDAAGAQWAWELDRFNIHTIHVVCGGAVVVGDIVLSAKAEGILRRNTARVRLRTAFDFDDTPHARIEGCVTRADRRGCEETMKGCMDRIVRQGRG